eukprot:6210636-Pleurochrysis_carterae.AAC.3
MYQKVAFVIVVLVAVSETAVLLLVVLVSVHTADDVDWDCGCSCAHDAIASSLGSDKGWGEILVIASDVDVVEAAGSNGGLGNGVSAGRVWKRWYHLSVCGDLQAVAVFGSVGGGVCSHMQMCWRTQKS